jgi:YidC/Oxa1 family membrane protein insertase
MKLFKSLAVFFLIFGLFAVSGCTSKSFCSEKDIANISEKVVEKLDEAYLNETTFKSNDGKVYGFAEWKAYYIEQNKITDQAAKDAVTIENWNNQTKENKVAYAKTIYNFDNAACLTLEERPNDLGALIEPKTFNDALELGLIEGLFVFPLSFLLMNFGSWLGGTGFAQVATLFIVTFLVRGVVLALTWKSTQQSQKMTALQEEMNKINAKYGDAQDTATKNRKSQEMMDLYQKHGVNPMKSMLVPFITLPIFIAFYGAVRQTMSIRDGEIFGVELGSNLGDGVTALFQGGSAFPLILLILMSGLQFVTMKLPQWLNKKKNPQPKYKQKQNANQPNPMMSTEMMTYMMLAMIVVASWVLPVAMTLYWVSSSLFSVFQTSLFHFLPKKDLEKKRVSFRG